VLAVSALGDTFTAEVDMSEQGGRNVLTAQDGSD
jgi:hypothetical protein